ncbi:MAG: glycosyltransferase family 2 protein [Micromonosporaceae bacterium]
MKPLVSIIIPTRNRPAPLREALASLAGQTAVADQTEVIVVNDGGLNIAPTIRYARDLGLDARLITHRRRRGLPVARNSGLQAASGDFVGFLDDDDVLLPHHLVTALKAHDEDRLDAVYTTCLVSPRRLNPASTVTGVPHRFDVDFDPELLSVCNFMPVHSLLFRRLPDTARFDPTLPALEDWDMWLRLVRDHGARLRHIPEPTVIYHRIRDTGSMTGDAARQVAAFNTFGDLLRGLWRRWPTESAKVTRFRGWLGVLYWHVLARLAADRPVNPFYYERCVQTLVSAWNGLQTEDDLIERLAATVVEETDAPTD